MSAKIFILLVDRFKSRLHALISLENGKVIGLKPPAIRLITLAHGQVQYQMVVYLLVLTIGIPYPARSTLLL